MLPQPFINYIPKFFRRDTKLLSLANKADEHLDQWREDVLNLNTIIDPLRMPSNILDDVGDYLSAGILNIDTDRIKRQKIWNAIESHRLRGTFQFDVKPTLDIITGFSSSIFSSADSSDFIVLGGEASDPDIFWATIGIDSVDTQLGIDMVGSGDEAVLTGVILINLGGLYNDIDRIREAVIDKIPGYLQVVFGYVDTGRFIELPLTGFFATEDGRRLVTEDGRTLILE